MTTLKTLKDLKEVYTPNMGHHHFVKNLKQEAIKWVIYKSGSNLYEDKEVVKWIKYFFNITEEDLK